MKENVKENIEKDEEKDEKNIIRRRGELGEYVEKMKENIQEE
jgi:hypothetical protein